MVFVVKGFISDAYFNNKLHKKFKSMMASNMAAIYSLWLELIRYTDVILVS